MVAPIFFLDSSQAAAAAALIEIKNTTSFITVGFELVFFAIIPSFVRRVNFLRRRDVRIDQTGRECCVQSKLRRGLIVLVCSLVRLKKKRVD